MGLAPPLRLLFASRRRLPMRRSGARREYEVKDARTASGGDPCRPSMSSNFPLRTIAFKHNDRRAPVPPRAHLGETNGMGSYNAAFLLGRVPSRKN
jgi:hypothetical protein